MHSLRRRRQYLQVAIPLLVASSLFAQQGGIVLHDQAPIYVNSTGDKVEFMAEKGWPVAGSHRHGLDEQFGDFDQLDGRIHVVYFAKATQKGLARTAWMNPSDIAIFEYECSCDKSVKCSPLTFGVTREWTDCFKKARDEKVAELSGKAGGSATASSGPTSASGAQARALTNDDIIALSKAGLGDDVILSKISQSPARNFDTSVDALIHLKKEGVSKPVIDAMVKAPATSGAAATSEPAAKGGKAVPASKVRVTANSSALASCKSLGTVHAEIDTFWGGGSDTVTRRLQEEAARKGGNTILLMGGFTTIKKQNGSTMMGDAEVYSCAD